MARKISGGQGDFAGDAGDDNFGRQTPLTGYFVIGAPQRDLGPFWTKGQTQGTGLIHQWTILQELDPTNADQWKVLLAQIRGAMVVRGEPFVSRRQLKREATLEQAFIDFGGRWDLNMAQLKQNADFWPAETGVVIVPSGAKRLARIAYRRVAEMKILILEEVPFHEIIRSGGVSLLTTADDLHRYRLAELGFVAKEAKPHAHFKAELNKAAQRTGLKPDEVIMVISGSPRWQKKGKRWKWSHTSPCLVEESDWDKLMEIWATCPDTQGELLMFFALDKSKYTAFPLSRRLLQD